MVQVGIGCLIFLKSFLADFGKKPSDYYELDKLSPAYKIFFKDEIITIGDTLEKICDEFERIETGSSKPSKKIYCKSCKTIMILL